MLCVFDMCQSLLVLTQVLAVRYDPVKKVIYTAGNDHSIRVGG